MELLKNYALFFMATTAISLLAAWLSFRETKDYQLSRQELFFVVAISTILGLMLFATSESMSWATKSLFTIVFSVLSVSFYIDIKLQELPDIVTIIVLLCSVLYLFQPHILQGGAEEILVRLGVATIITGLTFIFSIKTQSLGMGDVKLFFPMLLMVGLDNLIFYAYNVLAPAFLVSLYFLVVKKEKNLKIAFGPFMIIGFVLTFSLLPQSIFIGRVL